MKYVIVKRQFKRDPENHSRRYLAHTSIICKSPNSSHIHYGNLKDKYILFFEHLFEGENFIKENLSRKDNLSTDFVIYAGKEINSHLCVAFDNVKIITKKKSISKIVKNEPVKEVLTKEEIDANIDRILKQSEKDKALREKWTKKDTAKSLYITVPKAPKITKTSHHSKSEKVYSTVCSRTLQNHNEIHAKILIKDINSGLYIRVPDTPGENCYLTKKKDCTLFENSNQSHYIVSGIQSRNFLSCYHDMKLIEVYLETDKPIREMNPITTISKNVIPDDIRYVNAVLKYKKLKEELKEVQKEIVKPKVKKIKKPKR